MAKKKNTAKKKRGRPKKVTKKVRKKPGPKPGTGGRPKIQFDLDQVMKLAGIGCTRDEIAWYFDCAPKTVERRMKEEDFCRAIEKGRAARRMSLRRYQWKLAEGGNVAMCIFLGKNELGQSDKTEHKAQVETVQRQVWKVGDKEIVF